MNRGKRLCALVRFFKWQVFSRLQDEIIVDWIDGARLAVRRGMTGATGNIYCGLHEYVDMRFLLDTLQPDDLFADLGANVGSYTVLASKSRRARSLSVEPDPDTLRALHRNIDINDIGDRVRVVETALGAGSGTISFTVGRDTVNRVAEASDAETRLVPLRTLDDILDGEVPRLIKIDVEGFEAEVFRGAAKTLADHRLEAIICETLDAEVMKLLSAVGFHRRHYNPETKALQDTPAFASVNAIMVRR